MGRVFCFLLFMLHASAAFCYEVVFTHEKAGWTKKNVSMSFLDPSTHEVLSTTEVGTMSNLESPSGFSGAHGNFLYVIAPAKKERSLAVFSLETQEEVLRIPIGQAPLPNTKFETEFLRVSDDGSWLVVLVRIKKDWRLDIYSRPSHELAGTVKLGRGVSDITMLDGNRAAVATSKKNGGDDALTLVDFASRRIIARHEMRKGSRQKLIRSQDPNHFVVLAANEIPLSRDPDTKDITWGDVVYLHKFSATDGALLDKLLLGYEPTLVNLDERNDHAYFATRRTLDEQGLTLWRLENGEVEELIATDLHHNPTVTLVDENAGIATILCGRSAVILDLKERNLLHEIELPLTATSGFLNGDARLAFFREATGSEVGVLDTHLGQVIGDSPTGSRGTKFMQFVVTTAVGMAVASYTGYFYVGYPVGLELHMLTDADEDSLYVINTQTGDVTVFEVEGFERLGTHKVAGPFQLMRFEDSPYVIVLGSQELAMIDPNTQQVSKSYQQGLFAGINERTGLAYFGTENGLQIIDIRNGELIHTVQELTSASLVLTPAPNPMKP